MSLLVVGSVALDSIFTPFGQTADALGGSAVYFSVASGVLLWLFAAWEVTALAQRWRLGHDERHTVVAEPLFTLRPRGGMPMRVSLRS